MFSLVSSRYERASMIVTSNKPFSSWGEIFGDDVVAAAMIDRLVHHAEILALKGDSYRLRGKDLDARPLAEQPKSANPPTIRAGGISLHSPTARCARRRRIPGRVTFQPAPPPQAAPFSAGETGPVFDWP